MPVFSQETAANLAQLIEYAYALGSSATPGTYPAALPKGLPSGYTVVALAQAIDDLWGYSNAQYYGVVATAPGQIVIAIRGTADITEWLIDFEFPKTPFTAMGGAGSVEYGFNSVFSSMTFIDIQGKSFDLTQYLNHAIAADPATEVIIEGHSLGGAIVSLFALAQTYGNAALKSATTVYTIASPAPGDSTFASFYDANAPVTYRIWNPWDVVPHSPPSIFGFAQVAGSGYKLEPTLSQLEQYDFLSLDCNHSLVTYSWLLDGSVYGLAPTCQSFGAAATAGATVQQDRVAKLGGALARMTNRTLTQPRQKIASAG